MRNPTKKMNNANKSNQQQEQTMSDPESCGDDLHISFSETVKPQYETDTTLPFIDSSIIADSGDFSFGETAETLLPSFESSDSITESYKSIRKELICNRISYGFARRYNVPNKRYQPLQPSLMKMKTTLYYGGHQQMSNVIDNTTANF